jgi:hypothetical protein
MGELLKPAFIAVCSSTDLADLAGQCLQLTQDPAWEELISYIVPRDFVRGHLAHGLSRLLQACPAGQVAALLAIHACGPDRLARVMTDPWRS